MFDNNYFSLLFFFYFEIFLHVFTFVLYIEFLVIFSLLRKESGSRSLDFLSKKETSGGNVVVPGPGSPILPILLLLYTVHIQLLHSTSLAIDSPRSYP